MKKKINCILSILLCALIFISNIIVGTPLKENTKAITYFAIIILLVYIAIYKIILKEKYRDLFKKVNKLDICIIIISLCSWIPIIFKTAVNIEESTNIAIRYLGVLTIYIMSRILFIQDKKYIQHIISTFITVGVISVIIGIDSMTYNFFTEILNKVGIPNVENIENRMFGNFKYANTFAISMLLPLILSTEEYKKKTNYFFIAINFIFTACILLSYSKAVYLMFMLWIIICFFIKQENNEKVNIFLNTIFQILCAIIYSKIFMQLQQSKNFGIIWFLTLCFMLLAVVFAIITRKIITRKIVTKKTIKFEKLILYIGITLIIIIAVGLKLSKPLILFENKEHSQALKFKISNIEPEKRYIFEFDIEAKALDSEEIYVIQIDEENEYLNPIDYHYIKLGSYSGIKRIEFKAEKRTKELALVFHSMHKEKQQGLKINSLKINGEEYILDYLYLPSELVNKIKNFSMDSLSVTQRLTFYKDAFKLIQRNPWTGIGGNGWNYKYDEVKTYNYLSSQVHSWPIQMFLEFGIISFIVYVFVIVLLISYFFKTNHDIIGIKLALGIMMLHSAIDFNLSFMNMLIYTFVLFSIISSKKKVNNQKEPKSGK